MTGDPYFESVVLLASFDDLLVDQSKYAHVLTLDQGGVDSSAALSSDESLFGSASIYSYTETQGQRAGAVSAAYSSAFNLGTGDWTMEIACYWPSIVGRDAVTTLITMGSYDPIPGEFSFGWGVTGTLSDVMFFNYSSDGDDALSLNNTAWTPVAAVWNQLAIERIGDTLHYYAAGTLLASVPFDPGEENIFDSGYPITIGDTTEPFSGQVGRSRCYFSALRITEGLGRFGGANYVPDVLPFPIGLPFSTTLTMDSM